MEEADSDASGSGRSVCTEVEMIARHLAPCMDKPDFLVYKNDLTKNPGAGESDRAALLQPSAMKVAMQLKLNAAPNLAIGKLACESAIGFVVDEKSKGDTAPWNLLSGETRKRYTTDMAAKVRTLCKHVASFYRRKGGPPKWYKKGLVDAGLQQPEDDEADDEGEDEAAPVRTGKPAAKVAEEDGSTDEVPIMRRPAAKTAATEDDEDEEDDGSVKRRPAAKAAGNVAPKVDYVFKYNENTCTALRISIKTGREEPADDTKGPDGDFMIAKWNDGTTWKYHKELHRQQKATTPKDLQFPQHVPPDGGKIIFKLKWDRGAFRLIVITKVKKDKSEEQQTQINSRYFDNEMAGIKAMEQRILSMYIRNPKTTKQDAMAEKMKFEKELKVQETEKQVDGGQASVKAVPPRKRPAAAAPSDVGEADNGKGEDAAETDTDPENTTPSKGTKRAVDSSASKGKKLLRVGVQKGIRPHTDGKDGPATQTAPKLTVGPPPTTRMHDALVQLSAADSSDDEK